MPKTTSALFEYDARALRKLAAQTHAQARPALIGGIAAGAVTGVLFAYAGMIIYSSPYSLTVPGAIVGALLGIVVGRRKAQALRLQAQMALCQVEIEEGFRAARKPVSTARGD